MGGVIDRGYTGEIKVILYNSSEEENVVLKIGQAIAQLVLHFIPENLKVVEAEEELLRAIVTTADGEIIEEGSTTCAGNSTKSQTAPEKFIDWYFETIILT